MSELQRATDAKVIDLSPVDQFRDLVAFIADGIVVVDTKGKVRLVNPAAEDLLGRPGRDLLGRPFGIPLIGEEAGRVRVVRPDGSAVLIEVRAAELEWDGEQCVAASLRDVTDRATLIEHQNETIERLRELDQLRTDFVGIVSHDLRSPMATIVGFVDTLRSNWDMFDDEHKMRMLDRIGRSTDQLAKLVENVLQVSQIESGKLGYKIKDVDIAALIGRVVEENDETGRIQTRVPDELPAVRADEIRQWQILTNLVTNALKFSPLDRPVTIDVAVEGPHVKVSVQDQGIGIDPTEMDKVFAKFSRLEQPADLNVKGSGLGLFICKAMVEAQDGSIWVDSEPGHGSTFSYTIPAAT